LLPNRLERLEINTQKELYDAIYKLRVRGAPAIGVAAAYGIYLAAREIKSETYEAFLEQFRLAKDYINSARLTAINLSWALTRMERCVLQNSGKTPAEITALMLKEANAIRDEDEVVCRKIGEYGLSLLKEGDGVLTHCNPGALATVRYGTATAPFYLGQERGYNLRIYANETRPLLQGARLTAYELHVAGMDVTLQCDNMASVVMEEGLVQAVFVGCDRVAANGDTANKIGTNTMAILAKYYGIPFYVFAPMSSIDMNTPCGKSIKIEQRPASEVTDMWYQIPMAPNGIKVFNPAFDISYKSLITAIITENGIVRPPYADSLVKLSLDFNVR